MFVTKKPITPIQLLEPQKKTNRYEAECFAIEYLQKGNIVTKENITLEEYSENFFKWKYQ